MKDDTKPMHQSLLPPADNKFHVGNGEDGKCDAKRPSGTDGSAS